jgi:hypothetical protein
MVMSQDTLPESEKAYALHLVKATLDIGDEVVDTAEAGPEYRFDGHHYGVWGKMSKSVGCITRRLSKLMNWWQGKLAPNPKEMHPREFLGSSIQSSPYLDRAVRLLSDNFNASHFMYCPATHFNRGIARILAPALAKVCGIYSSSQFVFTYKFLVGTLAPRSTKQASDAL